MKSIHFILKSTIVCGLVLFCATLDVLGQNKPAPDFTLIDSSGVKYSLSQFKGKVIYMEIWATWCGPCIKELPHSEELRNHLKDNPDIVMLNISFDKDTLRWKKKIAEKNLAGIQLICPGGEESKMRVNYDVKTIPRTVIIGKDGTIEDFEAPRPSNKGVAKTLLKLAAKQ